jgi:uroporphyrin-III C-methyltransferase
MPGRKFRTLAEDLIASGIEAATPCVAISKATTPDEQVYATTLSELDDDEVGPAPVILLIGYAIQIPADRTRVVEELIRL